MARGILDLAVRLNGFCEKYGEWAKANLESGRVEITDTHIYGTELWIRQNFSRGWAKQFSQSPHAWVAVIDGEYIAGFACSDVPHLGFFGPIGVGEAYRGMDLGRGLTLAVLSEMECRGHDQRGYGYAIIHHVGPVEFYKKVCGPENIIELPRYKK